jgi:hypothetical protein
MTTRIYTTLRMRISTYNNGKSRFLPCCWDFCCVAGIPAVLLAGAAYAMSCGHGAIEGWDAMAVRVELRIA